VTLLPDTTRVLIPVELPEPEEIAREMVELLGSTRVVLLGWFETPDQISPEQAREEIEDTGAEALARLADTFRDAGVEVDVHHVFTPDLTSSVARVGRESGCDAALLAGPLVSTEQVLVLLREAVQPDEVAAFVGRLARGCSGRFAVVRVVAPGREEDTEEVGREALQRALAEAGIDADRLSLQVAPAEDPEARALELAAEGGHDVVVVPEVGELEEQFLGDFARRVGEAAGAPVLIVRARATS
jgi:nucleotide-binding universal stress UspA family protein